MVSTGRVYHSSLREEQAQETRLRIRRAARKLFGIQGVSATTVSEIAEQAGVSPATVYATFESKAGIVLAMLEDLEESAEIGPLLKEMFNEPAPDRQLRLYVAAHVVLFTSGADILRSAMQAIDDPGVSELWAEGDKHRREVIEILTAQWHEADALRPGLTPKSATDCLWLLTTVEGFLNAVDRLGWTPDEYESWLGDLAESQILVGART